MSDVLVTPAFQSAVPDSGDTTKLGPTAWNAARLFSGGADGQSVIRDSVAATGASWGERSRVLTVSTVQAGTPASLVETDLWTYALPANTLNANGRGLRITVWAQMAANANVKTGRVYFGATVIAPRGGADNNTVNAYFSFVIRTSPTAQTTYADIRVGSANGGGTITTPAETLSGAVTIKYTGQNGSASANDIVFKGAIVELLN